MPRRRPDPLPLVDRLLTQSQAAKLCRVSYARWGRYFKQHELLLRGRRIRKTEDCKRGCTFWLRTYVVRHLHEELPSHFEDE